MIPLILVPCASLHDPFRFLAPLGLVPYAYRHDLSQFWFFFLPLVRCYYFIGLLGAWGGDSVGFVGCWILVEELIFFPWLLGDVLDFLFWL